MTDWKTWIGIGALAVVFGILALGNAVVATLTITMILGGLFSIVGVAKLWAGFSGEAHDNRGLSMLWGLVSLMIGVSFVANPVEGAMSLTLLVTGFLLASGVIRLIMAWRMRQMRAYWMMLISGAVTVLIGGYLLGHLAMASLTLLGIFLGIDLLVDGIALIGFGLFLRSHRD